MTSYRYPIATRPGKADLGPVVSWAQVDREFPEAGPYFDAQNPLRGRDMVLRVAKRVWVSNDSTETSVKFHLLAIPITTDPIINTIPESGPEAVAFEGAAAWHAEYSVWVTYSEWSPWVVWPDSGRQNDARAQRAENAFFARRLRLWDAKHDMERLSSIGNIASTEDLQRVAALRRQDAQNDAVYLRTGILAYGEILRSRFGDHRYIGGFTRQEYMDDVSMRAISVRVVGADGIVRAVEDPV